jgi:hypothetical protein
MSAAPTGRRSPRTNGSPGFWRCRISPSPGPALTALEELGLPVVINAIPNEIPDPIAFPDDHVHSAYDPGAAHRFWRALVQVDRVFKLFRTGFLA